MPLLHRRRGSDLPESLASSVTSTISTLRSSRPTQPPEASTSTRPPAEGHDTISLTVTTFLTVVGEAVPVTSASVQDQAFSSTPTTIFTTPLPATSSNLTQPDPTSSLLLIPSGGSSPQTDIATATSTTSSSIPLAPQAGQNPPSTPTQDTQPSSSRSPSSTRKPPGSQRSLATSGTNISSITRGKPTITSSLTTASGTTGPMMETPSTAVGAIRSSTSSKATLVVVFAVLFGVLSLAVAVYFLYRRLRRRRGSSFHIRNYRPARGIEVHIASSTTEEKVDVMKPSIQVQEEVFLLSPHNSSTSLSTSAQQSQFHDPHEPNAISTEDAVHSHHVHGESTDSTNLSYASTMSTPSTGMALFASPATTFASVSASPQTRRSRFGPSWHYSPRPPLRNASRTSSKLQDARDALLSASWKGHMLSTLLEGDTPQRSTR